MRDEHSIIHDVLCRVAFSHEGQPAIELFQAVPGTPLAAPADNAFHHVGCWVDDVDAEAGRFESLGWPCFASSDLTMHAVVIDIRRGPGGVLTELCDVHHDRPSLRDLLPSTPRRPRTIDETPTR